MLSSGFVQDGVGRSDRFGCNVFHFRQDVVEEIYSLVFVVSLDIFLEILIGKLISLLVFSVICSIFLDGVVC